MNIAFFGLGQMGSGMVTRLLADGQHQIKIWNRTHEKTIPFVEQGATVAADPVEAVCDADLIITSLLDDQSIEALFNDQSDVIRAMRLGAIHLCVTTISPKCSDRLQALHEKHGSQYISGPVLGRPDASANGKLVQFLAGDSNAAATVEPICRIFSELVVYVSETASVANSQKLCINFFVAALIEVMGECFTLGEKLGVPRKNLALFLGKSLPLPGLNVYVEKIFKREVSSEMGFTMKGGKKDLALMLEAAESVQCPIEIANVIANKMDVAIEQGMSQLDWSATQEITRQRAGL